MKSPKSKDNPPERTPRSGEEQEPTWQDPGAIASDREEQAQEEGDEEQQQRQQREQQQQEQQGQAGQQSGRTQQ
jgi:hypothetical protein